LDHLSESVEQNRPVAFVVNAIVGIEQVGDLKNVVESMMAGAEGFDGRVAFVIGVNAVNTQKALLERKLAELDDVVQGMDQPIALTGITFEPQPGGGFPYGTVRNETMTSEAGRFAIAAFTANGHHPYISVQDFDTGSRQVPS